MSLLSDFIKQGKANMVIDGQFGSTGKGLICSKIALDNHIDIVCARLSPNAGHTFYYQNKKYITKLIPVSAIIQDKSTIYFGFNSVIDIDILFKEIEEFNIDTNRIYIHPRASIISHEMKRRESSRLKRISSTLSGTGEARSDKILRQAILAKNKLELIPFIKELDLHYYLDKKCNIFIETGQGYELSLNVGFDYPHCTSVDITPSAILADFNIHPKYMGNCMLSMRLYPIRVGNSYDDFGNQIGYSGPIPKDSIELSWEDLNVIPEKTTVTNKIRRIFTFSKFRYNIVLNAVQPSHVFLNFVNYARMEDIELFSSIRKPDYIATGPRPEEIQRYDSKSILNYIFKHK